MYIASVDVCYVRHLFIVNKVGGQKYKLTYREREKHKITFRVPLFFALQKYHAFTFLLLLHSSGIYKHCNHEIKILLTCLITCPL